jgi:TolA-binding protein
VININPSPQIVYVPQPFFMPPPDDDLPPQRPRVPDQPEMIPVPPPEKEKPKQQPPPPKKEEPKKEEPKKEEPKLKGPRPDVELPRPPEGDPRDEYARLIRTGREMFGDEEYGRAAARFRQAIRLEPDRPQAHFLLVQSLLERGDYHDAYDALLDGLKRDKIWPTAKFRPQELYGGNLEEYTRLLEALERAQAKHPNDPAMLLLRGHALWFDGRKQQAAALFRKALAGPDRAAAERFLAELPDEGL